jgi:UDP-N-acetyl-D-glucosamine dehydrogenase
MALVIQKSNVYAEALEAKIKNKQAVVAVVGLGYVGLPNAVAKAQDGFRVIGYDLSTERVESIKNGFSYIDDVPSSDLKPLVENGLLDATNNASHLNEADIIVVCVPTPIDQYKQPDLSYVRSASVDVSRNAKKGALIILESTTYPNTTEEMLVPLIEESGFQVGEDIFVAYSPERIDPGNKQFGVRNTPVVVGGVTPVCGDLAALFLGRNAVKVSSPSVAEMIKIYENSFRYVNIAFANEMAVICRELGIDIWEVIEGASTKPFGFMPFYPSSGVGGHCIPVDPYYLSWKMRSFNMPTRLIELAGDINSQMPKYTVKRILETFNELGRPVKGSNILVVGVAYKKDIGDVRESPALDLISELVKVGANIEIWDTRVSSINVHGKVYESINSDIGNKICSSDMVIIVTDHSDFDYKLIGDNASVIFDTKNVKDRLGDVKGLYIRL